MTRTIDFDCNGTDEPVDVVVTLNPETGGNQYDPMCDQLVSIVHITNEGLLIDFYQEGELVRTMGRTWEEWLESCPQTLDNESLS